MISVTKKEGESNDSVSRRFTRKVQSTGLLIRKKRLLHRSRKKSKRAVRVSAQHSARLAAERAHLIKIGKLKEKTRLASRKK
ncbi:MAG: hypothetical protein KIH62_001580 [Candidatus Kerfeldbacteria bacterium]|nr:hypothetical protein [Candidatus Kerfeldbacteria bacterium]